MVNGSYPDDPVFEFLPYLSPNFGKGGGNAGIPFCSAIVKTAFTKNFFKGWAYSPFIGI
jgi:hypothetical protein